MSFQRHALVFGAVLTVAACAPGPEAAHTTNEVAQPRSGGSIALAISNDISNVDPSIATRAESQASTPFAYEGLLGFTTGPEVGYLDLVLRPRLAERWEVSPDARTYTFYLRRGVKFADLAPVNGRELTSSDVKWSYEYWSRTGEVRDRKLPPSVFVWMLEGLERVETPDAQTAIVRFKEPFVPFLAYAATFRIPVVPRDIYDQDGSLQDRIVGTGAFQLDTGASQRGSHWVWKKNPAYWDQGKPHLDMVRTLLIADESATRAAFQARQVDQFTTRIGSVANELRRSISDAQVNDYHPPSAMHLWLNVRSGRLLADPRLRKAVSLAIDRDEIIRTLQDGRGQWSLAGVFPGFFTEAEVKQLLRFDPGEASRLVSEAGYPQGVELVYMLSSAETQLQTSKAQLLQAQLRKAGINLTIKVFAHQEWATKLRAGDGYDIGHTNRTVDPDVDSNLYAVFHSSSPSNLAGVNDPKADALVKAQRRDPDPARRREAVREAASFIAREALGLTLPYDVEFRFTQPYVRGYYANFGDPYPLAGAWVNK